MYHTHLAPDPYTHRRAFFRINRIASKILLIQPRIDFVHSAEESNKGSLRAETDPQKMQTRFRNHAQNTAKKHIDLTPAFHDHCIKINACQHDQEDGSGNPAKHECTDKDNDERHLLFPSEYYPSGLRK